MSKIHETNNQNTYQEFLGHFEVAEIEVNYRPKYIVKDRPVIKTSKDSYTLLKDVWQEDIQLRERINIIYLNTANNVLGVWEAFSGGIAGTVGDVRLVFATALKLHANSIIISHNHPSGSLKPSNPDIRITKRFQEAGKILDVPVLDHLIITTDGYFSFADEGLI